MASLLFGSGLLFERPLLLVGGGGVFAWLLALQAVFVVELDRIDRTLSVTHAVTPATTAVEEPATLTLEITAEAGGLEITTTARPSAGLRTSGELTTPLGESLVVPLHSTIVGAHAIDQPRIDIRDTHGFFEERLHRGPKLDLIVEPRTPKRVHIGQGGTGITAAFGEHTAQSGESGLLPAELREYVAGDAAARIDWKATARLATPHVREYDLESALVTCFLFDRRSRLDLGPPGETAFEYLRAAALTYATVTAALDDPVGLVSITDGELEQLIDPTAPTRNHERLRRQLRSLSVEESGTLTHRHPSLVHRSPTLDQDTRFGWTMTRYLAQTTPIGPKEPLTRAVRYGTSVSQSVQFVLFTDDADRADIRNAVTEARQADCRILLFLTPQALHEPASDTDRSASQITDRYQEFERFRRSLSAADHVTVYEVAPEERIETVLTATQTPQTRTS
jgi:uncharacterized protein (DUF58 family)